MKGSDESIEMNGEQSGGSCGSDGEAARRRGGGGGGGAEGLQVTETYYTEANKSVIFQFYCAAVWASRLPAVWAPLINSSTIYCRCVNVHGFTRTVTCIAHSGRRLGVCVWPGFDGR